MSDSKPFYAPDKEPPKPRTSKPGMHVWTMTKKGHTYRAELRDRHPAYGCELQVLLDGELSYGHLFPNRDAAIADALARQATLARRGWTAAE
jgi:hypothetical protein